MLLQLLDADNCDLLYEIASRNPSAIHFTCMQSQLITKQPDTRQDIRSSSTFFILGSPRSDSLAMHASARTSSHHERSSFNECQVAVSFVSFRGVAFQWCLACSSVEMGFVARLEGVMRLEMTCIHAPWTYRRDAQRYDEVIAIHQ